MLRKNLKFHFKILRQSLKVENKLKKFELKMNQVNPCKCCNQCTPFDPNCCVDPVKYSYLPPCNFYHDKPTNAPRDNIFYSPMCNQNFIEKKVKPCKDFMFCDNGCEYIIIY